MVLPAPEPGSPPPGVAGRSDPPPPGVSGRSDPPPPGVSGRSDPPPPGVSGPREVDLDWRSVAWVLVAFVGLVAVTGLIRSAPRAITVLAVGSLLALALDPLVSRIERRLRGHRAPAVAVVVLGLVVVAALAVALLVPPAVDQGREIGTDINQVVGEIEELPVFGDDLEEAGAADAIRRWIEELPDRLRGDATPLRNAAIALADGILVTAFTLLVTITLLLDGQRLLRGARRLVPAARRSRGDRLARLTYSTVGRYVAGSLLVAMIAGLATLMAGLALGVPLTPLVAVWVAMFDLVPQIGGAAGGIPFVLLGLTKGAGTAAACAVFFVLYLQFENHILGPLIVGRAVKLSPPATMTAALIGVSAGGVVGALMAVPLVAAAKVAYVELRPGSESPESETETTARGMGGDVDGKEGALQEHG